MESARCAPTGERGSEGDHSVQTRLIGVPEGDAAIPFGPPSGLQPACVDVGGESVKERFDGIVVSGVFLIEQSPGNEEVQGEYQKRCAALELPLDLGRNHSNHCGLWAVTVR